MSLYTVAQAEPWFILASNLDSSTTEEAHKAGLTASSTAYGTITQNASSLTGNASYDFSSNGRVLHQWSGSTSTNSFILEGVFKRTNNPGSTVTLLSTPGSSAGNGRIRVNSSGQLIGTFTNAFSQTVTATSSTDYCDGNWHHVVFAYSRGVSTLTICRLYVDGVLVASDTSSISDSAWGYQRILNIGSSLNTAGTASEYFDGTIDFAAFYIQGTSGTTTQQQTDHIAALDAFVTSHAATYADKTVAADPATASALAVHPTVIIIRNIDIAADPATASATADGHYQTDIDLPMLLNQYMQSLADAGYLEQWYKFDQYKNVINYGNGGSSTFQFSGNADNLLESGVQFNGALAVTGSANDGNVFTNSPGLPSGNTEFSDSSYVAGVWIKTPSSITSGRRDIWSVSDSTGKGISVSTGGNTPGDNSIRFTVITSSGEHLLIGTTNVMDGNWHFVACKQDGTAMQLFIDGVSQGTLTANGSLMGTATDMGFGRNFVPAFGGDKILISNFFVGNITNIANGIITNIYNAGKDQPQGTASMPQPVFKSNSAFNNYVESKSPLIDYRFNESTGTPANFGSTFLIPAFNGTGYTLGQSALDGKAIKFTNRDTTFKATYSLASGTVSTDDKLTMGVLFKTNALPLPHPLIAFGGFVVGNFPAAGIGNHLLVNANGTLSVRSGNADNTFATNTGTTNYADSNWHLAIVVQDTSTLNLYVDGKLEFTATRSTAFTDSGEFAVAGFPGPASGANSTLVKFIDNAFVTNTAFTAQEAFDAWQAIRLEMDTTATAAFPMPAYQAGFGPTITVDVMTASATFENVFKFTSPATADGLFQMPNFLAQKVVSVVADPMTASAQAENPGFDIGENNQVLHMDASATFPEPQLLIPGFWFDNPKIATAEMVQPAIATTLGALIKPQSFNASSFLPLPPAYFTIADDLWYQRLLSIDQKSPTVGGNITFFNTSDNIYVGGGYNGWNATSSYNQITSPLPAAYGGYFDAQNRKALNFRNITLTTGYSGFGSGDVDFTFEAMIKTTKSNQVLFVGENETSANFQRTGIILKDGKLALTYSKDRREGKITTSDGLYFTGFKNIADGEWHHIIIQNRQTGVDQTQPRIQFWVDGELDIQRYGTEMYLINQIGYNSTDVNSYSDFTLSVAALNGSSMVEENEINLNYLAAINVIPIKAPVATASATATPNTKGRGNRGRALMLYFWPTQNASVGYYSPSSARPTFAPVGNNYHNFDQGGYGGDPDTFYQLTTYTTNGANKFYDWDIWPCPVVSLPAGDTWVGESHPILKDGIFKSGTDKGTVYVDPVTDNERYLNLMTDLKDLSQFDMICFRNYPDQSNEQDKYGVNAKGVVDEYFNLLDKNLFADFLASLREAVDTGISLFITNPQLAVDMGFIDTYHSVPDLNGAGNEGGSDPYVPIKINDPLNTGTPVLNIDYNTQDGDEYLDAYRNNYHEVVNTLEDLTDDASFIWTDEIRYDVDGSEYGELDRWWSRIEYRNGLQVGDKFLISTTPTYGQSYFAAPISAVKAGKVITKFADTYRHGLVERVNPYRNYATAIAVEPGTVVAGKQIGAKVFISFTDVVGIQQGYGSQSEAGNSIEQRTVSLKTDYWINYAYDAGVITLDDKNRYLADPTNLDNLYPNGGATYNALSYWTLNGQDIIGAASPFGDNSELTTDTSENVKKGRVSGRTRRSKRKSIATTGALPSFTILWGWTYPNISVPIPSINTRGLWWLSERLEYGDDLPKRPEAFNADGFMPQPTITGYKTATVAAQSAVASARIVETNLRSGNAEISALPLTAIAFFPERGTIIGAEVATATARAPEDIRTTTLESDQVVLYLVHVDPILYLREEVIK